MKFENAIKRLEKAGYTVNSDNGRHYKAVKAGQPDAIEFMKQGERAVNFSVKPIQSNGCDETFVKNLKNAMVLAA